MRRFGRIGRASTFGSRFSGYKLMLEGGVPTSPSNPPVGRRSAASYAPMPLTVGRHKITACFAGHSTGGLALNLSIDGKVVDSASIERLTRVGNRR
jgi:hypothetical protein